MKIKIHTWFLFLLVFLNLIELVPAQSEVIDVNNLKSIAIPIHIGELILALFISYMSLKFFRITKPIVLFLYIYIAIGLLITNTILYLFLYLSIKTPIEISFVNVYIISRFALIGMLISFTIFFYQWNRAMKRTLTK